MTCRPCSTMPQCRVSCRSFVRSVATLLRCVLSWRKIPTVRPTQRGERGELIAFNSSNAPVTTLKSLTPGASKTDSQVFECGCDASQLVHVGKSPEETRANHGQFKGCGEPSTSKTLGIWRLWEIRRRSIVGDSIQRLFLLAQEFNDVQCCQHCSPG